ncbi:MFS transporter [Bacillus sp. CLL-7-23]|uniref:MFS transporter n=1 Tax=Bacillus changyiensis TaxID=3004103 RepID=A0ABT4X151_9BACI|nr:MFS transporter [Bacillus changyiensis]MDA7026029.1 MFS transporter [Bacillus changyiensis]
MKHFKQRYSTPVWICFFGEFLTGITGAMLSPFLLLYLQNTLGHNLLSVLVIVGIRPLTEIIVTLVAGGWTDRIGRRTVILTALGCQVVSACGFMMVENIWLLALFYTMNGVGAGLYTPTQRAQITDSTNSGMRAEVFAVIHVIERFGATIGPVIGLAVYSCHPVMIFIFQAFAFLLYWLAVYFKMPETYPSKYQKNFSSKKSLFLFMLPISLLYSQLETNYRYLEVLFDHFLVILTIFNVCHALLGMTLQIPLVKGSEKLEMKTVIMISYSCYAGSALGFAFSSSLVWLILSIFIFTCGESILLHHMQSFVSKLAPVHMRRRYFAFSV